MKGHEKQEQPLIPPGGSSSQSSETIPVHSEPLPHLGSSHAIAMAPGAYPYPDPYCRSIFAPNCDTQAYPPQPYPGFHLQLMGIQQHVMPLPSHTVEEPVFVNAKQYHGILRRRQSRAKLVSQNKMIKPQKPYLHESRHLHALRRPRGCGGRFLNSKKNDDNEQKEVPSNENTPEGNANGSISSDSPATAAPPPPNGTS
ncbi:PREDICTED: nuclear transcription factor Y subunit A-7 [Tarenaya hassleriana]|uniref:nuclear transcription factor Y subunit A-7 n=1 Tax=Tarenaya hassleriana TaxID=28532 RepID=UPI00053C9EB4|nr:PREDICTED: nuclear transcription factor Y subunit A-7 [Tarenaya hassleriana]